MTRIGNSKIVTLVDERGLSIPCIRIPRVEGDLSFNVSGRDVPAIYVGCGYAFNSDYTSVEGSVDYLRSFIGIMGKGWHLCSIHESSTTLRYLRQNSELYSLLFDGHWEWLDLAKTIDGRLFVCQNNNSSASESEWLDTGITIDIGNDPKVHLSTGAAKASGYEGCPWDGMRMTNEYKLLPEKTRDLARAILVEPSESGKGLIGRMAIDTRGERFPLRGGYYYHPSSAGPRYCDFSFRRGFSISGRPVFILESDDLTI